VSPCPSPLGDVNPTRGFPLLAKVPPPFPRIGLFLSNPYSCGRPPPNFSLGVNPPVAFSKKPPTKIAPQTDVPMVPIFPTLLTPPDLNLPFPL